MTDRGMLGITRCDWEKACREQLPKKTFQKLMKTTAEVAMARNREANKADAERRASWQYGAKRSPE